jgi:hypothetical protein
MGMVTYQKTVTSGGFNELGGLGLRLNPTNDMGLVRIKRSNNDSGITSYRDTNGDSGINIKRYFEIIPTFASYASVDFRYWDFEVFGLTSNFKIWTKDTQFVKFSSYNIPNSAWNCEGGVSNNVADPKRVTLSSLFFPAQQRWITLSDSTNQPLPVDLVDFQANKLQNNDVLLTWKTASEINNSHFDIESSTNAKDWNALHQKAGKGNTNQLSLYDWVEVKAKNR